MVDEPIKKSIPSALRDIETFNSAILNSAANQAIASIAKLNTPSMVSAVNQSIANLGKLYTPSLLSAVNQAITSTIQTFKAFDWEKFEKAYRASMINEFAKLKDERITAILGQVLTEFWLNLFIKTIFTNSTQIQKLSFDTKRKILEGLGVIDGGMSSDLKLLDDIRAQYAHNFKVNKKEVLKNLEKINRYKNLLKSKKFSKRNGNNVRIRKTAIELLSDLIEIEEKYVIDVKKYLNFKKLKIKI